MKKAIYLSLLFTLISGFAHAQAKYLWATATAGGAHGFGTLVRGNDDGTNFRTVYSFDSVNGSYPLGKMAMTSNKKIFIVTELGGYQDSCVICVYDPATDSLTKVYDFMYQTQYGEVPESGVVVAANGVVYGTTSSGGAHGYGVIYGIDPYTNIYTDVHDFDSTGLAPNPELLPADDGNLYGITQPITISTGTSTTTIDTSGILFSFDPVHSIYTPLYSFPAGYAAYFLASLTLGSDHRIYGTVRKASGDSSILFRYDVNAAHYTPLHFFDSNVDGSPYSGLAQADNGRLYGVMSSAINGGRPVIYSCDTATYAITAEMSLDSMTGINIQRNMGKLSDGRLVFSTADGGIHKQGALVSFDVTTRTYSIMLSFDSVTTGLRPSCDLLEASSVVAGIPALSSTHIGVYPNPAGNTLYLKDAPFNTSFNITNTLGESLITGMTTASTQAIDISSLPAGMYFVNKNKFVKE